MTINFKIPWGWLAAGALISYILWVQMCSRPTATNSTKEIIDTVRAAEKKDTKAIDSLMAEDKQHKDTIAQLRAQNRRLEGLLTVANTNTTALANQVVNAHQNGDTVKFYKSCDSLAELAKSNEFLYNDALAGRERDRLQDSIAMAKKDLIIKTQENSRARLTAALNTAMAAGPRNCLYLGITGYAGKSTGGGDVSAEYVTKKGYTYGAGAVYIPGLPWMGKFGVKKLLSFRKN